MEKENSYVVGLGEVLFDVFPTGSKLGGAPANFAYHAGQHGLQSVAVRVGATLVPLFMPLSHHRYDFPASRLRLVPRTTRYLRAGVSV